MSSGQKQHPKEPINEQNTNPSFAKKTLFIGLWACASLFIAFAALEILFRVGLEVYQCDDDLGWTFKPDWSGLKISRDGEFFSVVHFNSDGFRDREWNLTKPENTFRIVLMGDSFAAGLQVPVQQVFARQIEESLGRVFADDHRIEILNAAVDGYGTAQALLLYSQKIRHYKPNLVLLAVFPGNDLADNWLGSGHLHYIARSCGRPYYKLSNEKVVELGLVKAAAEPSSMADRLFGFFRIYANLAPLTGQADFRLGDIRKREHPDAVDRAWVLTKQLLLKFHQELRRDGSRLAVVIFGSALSFPEWRFQHLGPERLAELRQTWPIEALLEEFLVENGIPRVNLVRRFKQNKVRDIDALFFPRDRHLSAVGHKKAAHILHDWIVEQCADLGLTAGACRKANPS